MASADPLARLHLSNVHCPSCVERITDIVGPDARCEVSILTGVVTFARSAVSSTASLIHELEDSGFEVDRTGDAADVPLRATTSTHLPTRSVWLRWLPWKAQDERARREAHRAVCAACRAEEESVRHEGKEGGEWVKSSFSVQGMTCACVHLTL